MQAVSGGVRGVYLVGGAVRDLLLGEPGFDIDIAVEGDLYALLRTLHGAAPDLRSVGWRTLPALLAAARRLGVVGAPLAPPPLDPMKRF